MHLKGRMALRTWKLGGVPAWFLWTLLLVFGSISTAPATAKPENASPEEAALQQWAGLKIQHIRFEGVTPDRLQSIRSGLPIKEGAPLLQADIAATLRTLFATGLFQSIRAEGVRVQGGVDVLFRGTPRFFIGTVTVDGARGATVNNQLERAARLNPGTRFTQGKLSSSLDLMKQVLAENGYFESAIDTKLTQHVDQQLTDIAVHVKSGPQARVGKVEVTGDSGLTTEEFLRHAHLRIGAPVDRDTVSRALAGLLKYYRGEHRLEAEIKLAGQSYAAHKVSYRFTASKGPVVHVEVTGAKVEQDRVKRLVPIFEEGTVDDDLLNEGNRRLRDYFQSMGYFDVKVDHTVDRSVAGEVRIVYNVTPGNRRRLERVNITGNHYFGKDTLEALLSVHAANALDRHGAYSQALVSADIAALTGVYQNNGFSNVKVTSEVTSGGQTTARPQDAVSHDSVAPMAVTYVIQEGAQQRVGLVTIDGNAHVPAANLQALMNTEAGQLLSPRNLAGDRDALTTDYLGRGFDQVQVQVSQTNDPADPAKVNVGFHVDEGPRIFVRKVLLTGLHYTRPETVMPGITLHPGDPLSETGLHETQRNLYEFALFNEVNTAVQNPNGEEQEKTVLVQAVEARRYTFTYGAGFEVQTGTPVNGCAGLIAAGVPCLPDGKTGISPRLLLALTRNNLFGREQSASVQANTGLLEQNVNLIYENPHIAGRKSLSLTFTGGYANSHAVTTYVASRLEAGFRLTQSFNANASHFSRANSFVYGYDFRRVKVAQSSLQIFPNKDFIDMLSSAVRVGGPSVTWVRDTRDSAIDAHRGTYTSFQEFLSLRPFGAEAQFNRIDVSNSSYYGFDKNRFVLARNTRYGQERALGSGTDRLLPLPERLYAGGATSFRAFGTNAAGPRDPQTGFPIGGAGALINNVELRLPPPNLPYFGNSVSFVLFHDMGNVFNNAGDIWESALHYEQPNRNACKVLTPPQSDPNVNNGKPFLPYPGGTETSTGPHGACSFNYFNHSPGVGMRYHTPVGPIRLDFSYTLNPPIFPIDANYSQRDPSNAKQIAPFFNQHVGEGPKFNFFFSLGQTF